MIPFKKSNYDAFIQIKIIPTLIILITEYLRYAELNSKTQ